jgi:hypothetical protein
MTEVGDSDSCASAADTIAKSNSPNQTGMATYRRPTAKLTIKKETNCLVLFLNRHSPVGFFIKPFATVKVEWLSGQIDAFGVGD